MQKPHQMSGRENYVKHAKNEQVLFSFCGNNRLDKGEVCDDGNLVDGDGCSSYCFEEKKGTSAPLLAIAGLILAAVIIIGFMVYRKSMNQSAGVKTEGGETDKEMVFTNKA